MSLISPPLKRIPLEAKPVVLTLPSISLANQALFSPGLLPLPVHTFPGIVQVERRYLKDQTLGAGIKTLLYSLPRLDRITDYPNPTSSKITPTGKKESRKEKA